MKCTTLSFLGSRGNQACVILWTKYASLSDEIIMRSKNAETTSFSVNLLSNLCTRFIEIEWGYSEHIVKGFER